MTCPPPPRYQVASCALVLDCAVHVWDVRRPHVPLATFAEHRDVTTAIAWLADPHTFLSTSRVCTCLSFDSSGMSICVYRGAIGVTHGYS